MSKMVAEMRIITVVLPYMEDWRALLLLLLNLNLSLKNIAHKFFRTISARNHNPQAMRHHIRTGLPYCRAQIKA